MMRRNENKRWTRHDDRELRTLIRERTPERVIALKLGRTVEAIKKRRPAHECTCRAVPGYRGCDNTTCRCAVHHRRSSTLIRRSK